MDWMTLERLENSAEHGRKTDIVVWRRMVANNPGKRRGGLIPERWSQVVVWAWRAELKFPGIMLGDVTLHK